MYKQLWKDYFSFTKKERTAVLVLVILIFVVFLLPKLFPPGETPRVEPSLKDLSAQLRDLEATDSAGSRYGDAERPSYSVPEDAFGNAGTRRELFYFDPNTLSNAGWKKLGLREKTINTIRNYLSKGGRFRQKEDIGRIYGLGPEEAERLLPYIRLPEPASGMDRPRQYSSSPGPVYTAPSYEAIDLNTTDTPALIALPGIGSRLAARILHFRERLGGFYDVEQVKEVYGLPDSTFRQVQSRLQASPGKVQKININTTGVDSLKAHPYIHWNIANAIIQYRMQHGNFRSVEDIQAIAIITPDLYRKLSPYLTVD